MLHGSVKTSHQSYKITSPGLVSCYSTLPSITAAGGTPMLNELTLDDRGRLGPAAGKHGSRPRAVRHGHRVTEQKADSADSYVTSKLVLDSKCY